MTKRFAVTYWVIAALGLACFSPNENYLFETTIIPFAIVLLISFPAGLAASILVGLFLSIAGHQVSGLDYEIQVALYILYYVLLAGVGYLQWRVLFDYLKRHRG